jgi:hypothetical protein
MATSNVDALAHPAHLRYETVIMKPEIQAQDGRRTAGGGKLALGSVAFLETSQ